MEQNSVLAHLKAQPERGSDYKIWIAPDPASATQVGLARNCLESLTASWDSSISENAKK